MLAALMDRMGLERIGGFAPGRPPLRTRQTDWFDAPPEAAPADRFGPATRMHLSSEALARLRRWRPDLRVWGLSATLGNLEQALTVLMGAPDRDETAAPPPRNARSTWSPRPSSAATIVGRSWTVWTP